MLYIWSTTRTYIKSIIIIITIKKTVITIYGNDKWILVEHTTGWVMCSELLFCVQKIPDIAKKQGAVYGSVTIESGTLSKCSLWTTGTHTVRCKNIPTRWFKVSFWSPSWRSLNLWKGHVFTIPKRSQRIARQILSSFTTLPQVFQPPSKVSHGATKLATDCLNDLESIWKAPGNKTIHQEETKIRQNLPKTPGILVAIGFFSGRIYSLHQWGN